MGTSQCWRLVNFSSHIVYGTVVLTIRFSVFRMSAAGDGKCVLTRVRRFLPAGGTGALGLSLHTGDAVRTALPLGVGGGPHR